MEEKKRKRGADFYIEVVNQWKKLGVITTPEFYSLFEKISKEKNYSFLGKSINSILLKRLENLLPEEWVEKVNSGKKGKMNMNMYSLKLKKGEEDLCIQKIEEAIKKNFEKKRKVEVKKRGNVKSTTIIYGRPQRSTFNRVYTILKYLNDNNKTEIPRSKVIELTGCVGFGESNLISWIKSFQNIGITVDAIYYSMGYNKCYVKVHNVCDALLNVRKAAEHYGINFEVKGKIQSINPKQGMKKPEKLLSNTEELQYRLLYAIGGIIMKNNKKPIGIDILCKTLSECFNIQETKRGIVESIKDIDEFEIIQHGILIGLKDGKMSWETLKENYGPQRWLRSSYARLTLPEDEIKEKFPMTKNLSKISENDALYLVVYEDTKHSLKKWIEIYRKFRGVDKIFDENLEIEIKNEIERIDSKSFSGILSYEIEEDRF